MSIKETPSDVKIVDAKLKYRPGDQSVIWLEFHDPGTGRLRTVVYQGKIVWAESREAD